MPGSVAPPVAVSRAARAPQRGQVVNPTTTTTPRPAEPTGAVPARRRPRCARSALPLDAGIHQAAGYQRARHRVHKRQEQVRVNPVRVLAQDERQHQQRRGALDVARPSPGPPKALMLSEKPAALHHSGRRGRHRHPSTATVEIKVWRGGDTSDNWPSVTFGIRRPSAPVCAATPPA